MSVNTIVVGIGEEVLCTGEWFLGHPDRDIVLCTREWFLGLPDSDIRAMVSRPPCY